jgi:hypothetical protein
LISENSCEFADKKADHVYVQPYQSFCIRIFP